MLVCNFTIAHISELKESLRLGRSPPASIPEIAASFLKQSASIREQEMTVDCLIAFLESFVEQRNSTAIVDLNDELKLYKVETAKVLRPKIAAPKTYTNGFYEHSNHFEVQKSDKFGEVNADKERMLQSQWSIRTEPVRASMSKRLKTEAKERRTKQLKEIFTYYARSNATVSVRKTFEAVQAELSAMNLSSFLRFARNFSIPVDTKRVKELFTKNAEAGRQLGFEKFLFVLEELAFEMSRERISLMEGERILMGQKLEKVNQKLLIETNSGKTPSRKAKAEKLSTAMKSVGEKISALKKLPSSEIFNEFYEFLGLDNLTVPFSFNS
eukprot:TRINITY_DN10493_c0_g1_i1.p1 TRINITY_DN10493_c0_g1~~TRINITY_DN10493_c0_g1_i1.p1  ORF type:complete len:327 (+),score=90.39 TRINITY_DN10493_c0_g1_i1:316-1296(+)